MRNTLKLVEHKIAETKRRTSEVWDRGSKKKKQNQTKEININCAWFEECT